MNSLNIDGRAIGPGKPTFVIAEIGVNHDGSVQKAIELARVAANCGADAVKLQIFRAAQLMHPTGTFAQYQSSRAIGADHPADMLRRYELSTEEVRKVVHCIRELNLIPLATPFSPPDMEIVESFHLPAVKVASPDLVNQLLLRRITRYGRPILLSTGAATIDEVEITVGWLRDWDTDFALLHCISSYPTPAEQANLCWINELARRFDVPVGYSDHTIETLSGAFAAAAGAMIVEKHLTLDCSGKGPDHAASADPPHFERYVKQIREADRMRGTPGKSVLNIEGDVRCVSRQSLVLRRDVRAGEILREDDLTAQRPGTGIPAAEIDRVVGRRVMRAMNAGSLLQFEMLLQAA